MLDLVKEFDAEVERLLGIKEALEADLQRADDSIEKNRQENAALLERIHIAEAELERKAAFETEVESLRAEHERVLERVEEMTRALREHERELKARDETETRLRGDQERLKDTLENLREQVASLKAAHSEAESRAQALSLEKAELEAETQRLREDVQRAEQRYEKAAAETEAARRVLADIHSAFVVSRNRVRSVLGE